MSKRDKALRLAILAALLGSGVCAQSVQAQDLTNPPVAYSDGSYDNVYGLCVYGANENAVNNQLTLSGPVQVTGQAAGGWSTYGSAIGNTVTIALDANGYIGTSSGLGGTVYGGGAEEEGAGSAMNNTVKLESGNVYGAVYGGASVGDEVNGSVGEASGNQVLMSGGSAIRVCGGSSGVGAANNNTVTLSGSAVITGTYKPVYGAYTVGGNASGNTVNIQASASVKGTVIASYSRDGELISGNKINMTGGTVNGELYGAYTDTATGFSSSGRADVLNNEVNISGGSGVTLAWGGNTFFGLAQGNKVNLSAGTVSQEIVGGFSAQGDVVDNQVTVKGTGVVGGSGSGNVYAGLSNGSKAAGNILYIQEAAEIRGKAYGALQQGNEVSSSAERNQVFMSGGSVGGDVYGSSTKTQAFKNNVEISGGTVGGSAYSAYAEGLEASENTLTLSGGSVTGTLYAGYAKNGTANQNQVTFSGGSLGADAYAGYARNGAEGNTLLLSGNSVVPGNALAGFSQTTAATGNTLALKDHSEVKGNAAGGAVYMGSAANNTVLLQNNGQVDGKVYGGLQQLDPETQEMLDSADAYIEEIRSSDLPEEKKAEQIAQVQARVEYIQQASAGTAEGNQVLVNGGAIAGNIYGGAVNSAGDAVGNSVTFSSGYTTGAIYGGYAAYGNALDNTVTIKGGSLGGTSSLYGGRPGSEGTSSGNTLNLYTKGNTVENLDYFQTLNFYVPQGTKAGETMLTVTKSANVSAAAVNAGVYDTTQLNPGEVINLVYNPNGITTDGTSYSVMEGLDKVTDASFLERTVLIKKQDPNTIVLYIPGDSKPTLDPGTKVIPDERDTGTSLVNEGSDLAVNDGFESALAAHEAGWLEDHSIKAKFTPYVVLSGHNLRYNRKQNPVDTNGFNGELGFVKRSYEDDYIDTSMPFLEYGNGNFTIHYPTARADGGQHYAGAGILLRRDQNNGFHYEGMVRAGRFSGDMHGIIGSRRFGYNTSSNYFAAHLGLGKVYTDDTNDYDWYGKVFYAHLGSDTVQIRTNAGTTQYQLDSVDSLRTRLGFRWTKHLDKETSSVYAGLGWDYEFKGEAKAYHGDYTTPAASLKGSSEFLELGWQSKDNKENPWGVDLRVRGWIGKKQGFTYTATITRRM